MSTTTIGKAPPGRPGPQPRAAAPKPPVAAKAKASAETAARRRQLRADVATALGAPPAPAKAAAGFVKRASSTKAAPAPAKRAATTAKATIARKQAAPALKMPVPIPEPRKAPAKVQIKFPKLPGQAHAARYQAADEQQANLTRYRRFLSVARLVAEARKLTSDEKHQIELARARIAEIKALGLLGVR